MNREIKWVTLDSYDGTRTLKQHAFASKGFSLCGKIRAIDQDEDTIALEELISEEKNENACKMCVKISLKAN